MIDQVADAFAGNAESRKDATMTARNAVVGMSSWGWRSRDWTPEMQYWFEPSPPRNTLGLTRTPRTRMKLAFACVTFVGLLAALASCVPLPIPHTGLATPKVSGTLTHSDGTPMAGAVVAATNEGRDHDCRKFAVRDTTDAQGRFELPTIRERRRIFWLTMIENFGQTWYELCVQPADSLVRAQRSARTSVETNRSGGSLRCMDWEADAHWHLTCENSWQHAIVEGGRWTDGKTQGTYRLINVEPVRFESALAVQWIADSASEGGSRVRATVLALGGEPLQSETPQASQKDGRFYVGRTGGSPGRWRRLIFELGAPGELRLLPDSVGQRLFPK